jgi:hypothetical protein
MTIQLVDVLVRLPFRIVEDVPYQAEKFFVLGDFMAMEMEEDKEVSIILERSFLRTSEVIANMRKDTLIVRAEDEQI